MSLLTSNGNQNQTQQADGTTSLQGDNVINISQASVDISGLEVRSHRLVCYSIPRIYCGLNSIAILCLNMLEGNTINCHKIEGTVVDERTIDVSSRFRLLF